MDSVSWLESHFSKSFYINSGRLAILGMPALIYKVMQEELFKFRDSLFNLTRNLKATRVQLKSPGLHVSSESIQSLLETFNYPESPYADLIKDCIDWTETEISEEYAIPDGLAKMQESLSKFEISEMVNLAIWNKERFAKIVSKSSKHKRRV